MEYVTGTDACTLGRCGTYITYPWCLFVMMSKKLWHATHTKRIPKSIHAIKRYAKPRYLNINFSGVIRDKPSQKFQCSTPRARHVLLANFVCNDFPISTVLNWLLVVCYYGKNSYCSLPYSEVGKLVTWHWKLCETIQGFLSMSFVHRVYFVRPWWPTFLWQKTVITIFVTVVIVTGQVTVK